MIVAGFGSGGGGSDFSIISGGFWEFERWKFCVRELLLFSIENTVNGDNDGDEEDEALSLSIYEMKSVGENSTVRREKWRHLLIESWEKNINFGFW